MDAFALQIYAQWCADVVIDIHENMMKPLLVRTDTEELATNFDDKVGNIHSVFEGNLILFRVFAAHFGIERVSGSHPDGLHGHSNVRYQLFWQMRYAMGMLLN